MDAIERAALAQCSFALRIVGLALLLFFLLLTPLLIRSSSSFLWFFLPPFFVVLAGLAAGLGAVRLALRATFRLLGASGSDAQVLLLSRSSLAATLLIEGATGLALTGTFLVADRYLGTTTALQITFVVTAALGLLAALLSHVARSLSHVGQTFPLPPALIEERKSSYPLPVLPAHPGSLSELMAQTFGRALSSTALLLLVSSLGHAILLAHFSQLRHEAEDSLSLYPHLLRALGLAALTFGAFATRSSDREPLHWAWLRGLLVSFTLFIAAAWSLSSLLSDSVFARLLPAACTFLFLGVLLIVASSPKFAPAPQRLTTLSRNLQRFPSLILGLLLSALVLFFFFLLQVFQKDTPLPALLPYTLLSSCCLTLFPLLHSLQFSHQTTLGTQWSVSLIAAGEPGLTPAQPAPAAGPPSTYWLSSTFLALLIGFEAVRLLSQATHTLAVLAWSLTFGVLSLLLVLVQSSQAKLTARLRAEEIVSDYFEAREVTSTAPSFREVLDVGLRASRQGYFPLFALLLALPPLLLGFFFFFPQEEAKTVLVGLTLGVLLSAALVRAHRQDTRQTDSSFSLTLAFSFTALLLTGSALL